MKSFFKDTKAQAMVESAIVLPVFLMVIFSILQIGLVFNAKFLMNYAAYSACRIGIVRSADENEMKKGMKIILATLETVTANNQELIQASQTLSSTIDDNLDLTVEKNNPVDGVLYVKAEYSFNLIIPFGNVVIWNIYFVPEYLGGTEDSYMRFMDLQHKDEYRIPIVGECRMRMQS